MPADPDTNPPAYQLGQDFEGAQSPVMLEIEREVLGSDYGATSWSSAEEVARLATELCLEPASRVLELGAGSGWPALRLVRATGCHVTLSDLPLEGLRIALRRARRDRVRRRCAFVRADAARSPFVDGSFDAVYHCDVLC